MTDYEAALALLDSQHRYSQAKINSNPDLVKQIQNKFTDSQSLRETIYRIIHNINERPVCLHCGKPVEFIGKTRLMFRQYCCYECSRKSPLTMKRMKATNKKLHGGIGFASKELAQKSENTAIKIHGKDYRKTVQQVNARKTKKERYGDENYNNRAQAVLSTDYKQTYENYKKTMNKKYGVDNYYQSKECRKKCNSPESLEKAQQTRIKNGTLRTSKIEKFVLNYIKENYNFIVEENKRKYLDGKEIDIYLPELKIGIEIQGDYYHKNPRFYKNPNELANLPRTKQTTTVQDIWNYDNNKLLLAESKGIKLIQLWEYDINHNFDFIKKQLGELFQQLPKE